MNAILIQPKIIFLDDIYAIQQYQYKKPGELAGFIEIGKIALRLRR
jgi:hypothetical protein